MTIDVDELRKDMLDYYGTAMINGFPMAVADVGKVEEQPMKNWLEWQ